MLPAGMREEYSLLIGGNKTGKYSSLEKMVGELGMEGKVIFPGYISDEDAAALMAGAAVFVYPSKYEGFGYPPLEAMALGAPVICSTATSLGEVVGDAAIGVEPEPEPIAVAIEKVLSDPELRRSLIEKGAVRAKEFTTDIMARKYVEIMESLAGPS
jgi:glycosyltransferase involved in cell wall biosynthesis